MSEGPPPGYVEPARSYRSIWLLALILLAGFGVDLAFSVHGAVAHLPGWLVAAALVLGVDAVVIYAARATKSLHVEPEQVRVGDDALERALIESSVVGVDDELPVLGWSTGMPRGMRGVTMRLTDGSALVVPTRDPDRLRAALGHAADEPVTADVEIRPATDDDLVLLGEIEQRAGTVFAVSGYYLPDADEVVDYTTIDSAAVFVAGTPPVGFVQLLEIDGVAHLREIAVLPRLMRQGIGSRLVERAAAWAREQGYDAMTLTTYADPLWNAPYYAARGFAEIAATSPGLVAIRETEQAAGLDDVGRRVVMRMDLTDAPDGRP